MNCSVAGGARRITSEKGAKRRPGGRREKGDQAGRKRAKLEERETGLGDGLS
jgi:hypothetical protein